MLSKLLHKVEGAERIVVFYRHGLQGIVHLLVYNLLTGVYLSVDDCIVLRFRGESFVLRRHKHHDGYGYGSHRRRNPDAWAVQSTQ